MEGVKIRIRIKIRIKIKIKIRIRIKVRGDHAKKVKCSPEAREFPVCLCRNYMHSCADIL